MIDRNLAAFQHAADFSLVTQKNPALPGEFLVAYLTGLPATQPIVPTGQAAPFSPLAVVPQPHQPNLVDQFALLLNGTVVANSCPADYSPCQASKLLWLGLTPGIVVTYQLNFVMPPVVPFGNLSVQLQRSTCARIFGTGCGGMGAGFFPNASAGCILTGGGGTSTSSAVPLPVL